MVYRVERRKTVYHRGARPPQPRRRSSTRNIDFPDGRKLRLVQTTVVYIPGFEWVVTGQPIGSDGKPLPQVLSLAVWTVQSLPGGKSMFSRFFSLVGSEGSVTVSRSKNGALDPVGSQAALERLKKYLEGLQEKN